MKHIGLVSLSALLLFVGAGCAQVAQEESSITFSYPDTVQETTLNQPNWSAPSILSEEEIQKKQIRISTEKGDIVFELFAETAPLTVSNFVTLTKGGFYNSLTFHRREEGFVIQGGDPDGTGAGGPGYTFEDEFDDSYGYDRGIVAMANRGPDTNGSQFFIMLADTPLPKAYSIFGRVISGMEVVDAIAVGDTMTSVMIEDLVK